MPQVLIPIFTAIGFSAGAAAAISAVVFNLGLSLAISGVAKLLQRKPTASLSLDNGNQLTIRQPISSWRIIYGTVNAAAVMTYIEITNPGAYLHEIMTLAGHEVHSIGAMYFDGKMAIDAAGTLVAPFHSGILVQEKKPVGGPYPGMEAASAGLWTSAHKQQGRAGVHLKLGKSPELFPYGLPNGTTWDIEGIEVLDPRDSPVVPVFTDNPAMLIRDYMLNTIYGVAAYEDIEIDDDSFIAAANICDEEVPLRDSGSPLLTEKRYTCNGTFETSEEPWDIVGALLSCCAGTLIESGGKYKLYVGAYRTPNADTITEDDFRSTIKVQTRASKRDTFNGVKGVFISELNKWQPTDFPPYQSAAYLAEDQGEVIWKDLAYPFTTSVSMAQRLAKIELERTRRQVVVTLPCKMSQYTVAPLDVIKVTNERFQWTDKTFEVLNVKFALEEDDQGAFVCGVDIIARETDAAVYAWDPDTDETIVDGMGNVIVPVAIAPITGASNRAYRPLTNPLTATDAGADGTINVDDFTMRIVGLLDTPYDAGAITGLDFNTLYYVYFDDTLVEGGTVTYEAFTTKEDALADGRFFVGSCTTPSDGGPDTNGNDDGGGATTQTGATDTFLYAGTIDKYIDSIGGIADVFNSNAAGSVTNGPNCVDGDLTTYAEFTANGTGGGSAVVRGLIGWTGPKKNYTSLKIKVRYSVPVNTLTIPNGGTGFAVLIWPIPHVDGGDALAIPVGTTAGITQHEFDITGTKYPLGRLDFQVDVIADSGDTGNTVTLRIYEVEVVGVT